MSFPTDGGALSDELHVWLLAPSTLGAPTLQGWYETLSAREVRRHNRLIRQSDRDLYLSAHGFVREVLSSYWPAGPAEWDFLDNGYGRPEPWIDGSTPLRFNLSHTTDLVGVVVHDERDAGIDVETLGRVSDYLQVSRRVFSAPERAALLNVDVAARERRFYVYWTLKEAYIKARGLGMAIPLGDFWFDSADPASQITFSPELTDHPEDWSFSSWSWGSDRQVAVADRHGGGAPRRVRVFDYGAGGLQGGSEVSGSSAG